MFLVGLGRVFGVDAGLVAEGGGIGEVVDDEALHQLTIGEVPIEDVHFGLIDATKTLELALFVCPVGDGPLVFEDQAESRQSGGRDRSGGLLELFLIELDETYEDLSLVDVGVYQWVVGLGLMGGDKFLKEFIGLDEDIGLYLFEYGREAGGFRVIFGLSLRKHGYLGHFQRTTTIDDRRFLGLLVQDDDLAFDLLQFIGLIRHEQLIRMYDMTLPRNFVPLEDGPRQAPRDIIDVVLPVEVACPHGAVHADGRVGVVLILLLYQIGLEEEVPSLDLVVAPLGQEKVPQIVYCYPQAVQALLGPAGRETDILEVPAEGRLSEE